MWPESAALHPRQRRLHAEDDSMQVDVDHPLSGRVILFGEAAERHDPGIVDQDVERAEALLHLVEEVLERVAARDVELERDRVAADLRRRLLGEVGVEIADRDLRPLTHECLRGRPSDPSGAARDRNDLALQ